MKQVIREEDKYKGSYWKWTFKDSSYWMYLSVMFGVWGAATVGTWNDGWDPASLFFAIPAAAMVLLSYMHWKEMKDGRSS